MCLKALFCVLIYGIFNIYGIYCLTTDIETRLFLEKADNKIDDNLVFPTDSNVVPTELPAENDDIEINFKKKTEKREKPTITTTTRNPVKKVDPMDQYLLDGLLNIVDERFKTLSDRLMTLERGINNVQYYNVRSFRVVNTHLHTVDTILHGMHGKLDQVQLQHTALEENIGNVKQEVLDLESMNTGMFQAIEQNLVHLHSDMQGRIAELKYGIEQSNARVDQVKNDTVQIKGDLKDLSAQQKELLQNTEASVIMTSNIAQSASSLINNTDKLLTFSEHISIKSDYIQHSVSNVVANVTKLSTETAEIHTGLTSFFTNMSSDLIRDEVFAASGDDSTEQSSFQEFKSKSSQTQMTCSKLFELLDEKFKNLNVTLASEKTEAVTCHLPKYEHSNFKNQSRKLMRALVTVNDNIYQSVTLYKHTGNLIERVISDTELIANEQVRLREEILDFLVNGTMSLFNQSLPEFAEFINIKKTSDNKPKTSASECVITQAIADDMKKITENGTQLVELLTDLATSGTSSIQTSLTKLDQEITRLNKVQEDYLLDKVDSFSRDDPTASGSSQLRDMSNKTNMIYQLVEAISSNTGWIPYFFHNMRFVESQVNKTLKVTNEINGKSDEILLRQRANLAILFKPKPTQSPTVPTEMTKVLTKDILKKAQNSIFKPTKASPIHQTTTQPEVEDETTFTNQSIALDRMIEFVYATNVKIDRLIPALTNLLGEPEPYITLVNGETDKEGRVEIYHKGTWGTIAESLSHIEASYVCRKLGYLGGISVGSGVFGPGSGTFWNLNVTCLRTRWCEAVKHVIDMNDYDHSNDIGIICDHMLRLIPDNDEESEVSRHTGKLEIYHQNVWIPICYNGWGREATSVACQHLGFREGSASGIRDDTIIDSRWMTNVTCKGSESRLDACAFNSFEFNGCSDFKYVSLICS